MKLLPNSPSYPSDPVGGTDQKSNPYSADSNHIRETIEVATSIVRVCSQQGGVTSEPLSSLLEKICLLLTPQEDDDISKGSRGWASSTMTKHHGTPAGASYDSTMAGMAANSILSNFLLEGNPSQENNLAFLLANALARILGNSATSDVTTPNSMNATSSYQSNQIKAVIALNQLAATEPPPPLASSFDQEKFSPYGHPPKQLSATALSAIPTSWCHALVHSNALPALVQRVPSSLNSFLGNENGLELCAKCVWVIGNLAGDSEMARGALQRMEVLPRLIGCLFLCLGRMSLVQQQQLQQQQVNGIHQSLLDFVRNSIWTITNLFREGGISVSEILDLDKLHQNSIQQGDTVATRLAPEHIEMLINAPETFPPPSATDSSGMDATTVTWKHIASETCWLISFLTRDSVAVNFCCGKSNAFDGKSNSFITSIASRLVQATVEASLQIMNNAKFAQDDMGCLIPCCRALKNIANASDGRYVPSILSAQTTTGATVESSLAKIISFGSLGAGSEASTIAAEAAATAGACLYDACVPITPNPATLACRSLVPALCEALLCQLSNFEFLREAIWALWNAVNLPAEFSQRGEAVQKDLLVEIMRNSPNEMLMAMALTTNLSTLDYDAMEPSLRLINLLLRQSESAAKLAIIFEEVGLVSALWRICDNDSDESEIAEIAADLLDTFYEQEEEEEEEEVGGLSLEPTSSGGQFQFQTSSTGPVGGFNFNAAPAPPPMGRGRGRGHVVPAWMQKQQT